MTLFGKQLRYLRKRASLTQEDLSKILNVSASSIGMYERGSREPSYRILVEIANYFNVSIDYLLGHTKENTNTSQHLLHPKLLQNDEDILFIKEEFPELFNQLKSATSTDIKKIDQILRIIQDK